MMGVMLAVSVLMIVPASEMLEQPKKKKKKHRRRMVSAPCDVARKPVVEPPGAVLDLRLIRGGQPCNVQIEWKD